jgi:hypothetical protein
MPKQKTITVYAYHELEGQAKDTARDKLVEIIGGYGWDSPIMEEIKECLEECGIDNPQISYSGFWSQGDGLSFTGQVENLEKFIKTIPSDYRDNWFALFPNSVEIIFNRTSSLYCHEKTVNSVVSISGYHDESYSSQFWEYAKNLQQTIEAWRLSKCKEFYRKLETYYDDITTEETIAEYAKDGMMEFTKWGKLV